ncbi:SpdD-like protein [Streptomyces sparsus]
MLNPKYPRNPTPTGAPVPFLTPTAIIPSTTAPAPPPGPVACSCQHTPAPAPTVPAAPLRAGLRVTPGAVVGTVAAGTAVVLVVGTVLVSLLLAVALTATSVAVCAVVLRSLLNPRRHTR